LTAIGTEKAEESPEGHYQGSSLLPQIEKVIIINQVFKYIMMNSCFRFEECKDLCDLGLDCDPTNSELLRLRQEVVEEKKKGLRDKRRREIQEKKAKRRKRAS